jgi:hypothetical protein
MIRDAGRDLQHRVLLLLALALAAGAASVPVARAQDSGQTPQQFWHIPVWAMPGAWQDSTVLYPKRCGGIFRGPLRDAEGRVDSLRAQARTVTVRFLRNRWVEARPDFGGYRIYRVTNTPDSASMMLIRRFSLNDSIPAPGGSFFPLWHFSRLDPATMAFKCGSEAAYDSILTFVDPDSNGNYQKVCRKVDHLGRCITRDDSVWKLVAPPGPHEGFRTWYSVTYEARNTLDNNYEDLYVPDSSDTASCRRLGACPNLNDKTANMTPGPVVPAPAGAPNLETVHVVPNPFRGSEAWDPVGGNMIQFTNLPDPAWIRIYTVAGELVRELQHRGDAGQPLLGGGSCSNCEGWDLKNAEGRDVASGIYLYRIESGSFSAQSRFIVIR